MHVVIITALSILVDVLVNLSVVSDMLHCVLRCLASDIERVRVSASDASDQCLSQLNAKRNCGNGALLREQFCDKGLSKLHADFVGLPAVWMSARPGVKEKWVIMAAVVTGII